MTVDELRAVRAAVREVAPWVRLASDRLARRQAVALQTGELVAPLVDRHGNAVLVDPDDLLPVDLEVADALRLYWRELVRARAAILARPEVAKAVAAFHALGVHVLPELRAVLVDDQVIGPDAPDEVVARRAVALLGEAAAFDAPAVRVMFPSLAGLDLTRLDAIRQVLTEVAALKPAGAAEGVRTPEPPSGPPPEEGPTLERVATARDRGNFARAAILASVTPGGEVIARKSLADGLVPRVGKALRLSAAERRAWEVVLEPIAAGASGRLWGPAGRVLYDLQSLAADTPPKNRRSRESELAEVPHAVSRLRKLHAARRHLHSAERVSRDARRRLDELLDVVIDREGRLLASLAGPVIDSTLRRHGLAPENEVEEISHRSTVDHLMRKLSERGFLRMGDLRDALSHGHVKMADLAGPGEWLRGDALLRVNRDLGRLLPGAYWPGEVYLRWIHRVNSLAFGTHAGRLAWLYFLLPASVAVLTVEFVGYLVMELENVSAWAGRQFAANPSVVGLASESGEVVAHGGVTLTPEKLAVMVVLAVLVAVVVNSPRAQSLAWAVGRNLLHALTAGPVWVWNSRLVTLVRRSRVTAALATPTVVALLVGCATLFAPTDNGRRLSATAGAFVATALFIRTGRGRRLEVRLWQVAGDFWRVVTVNLLPGLIGWVLTLFRRLSEQTEKTLYAVDEFLRYRDGQSRWVAVGKTLGRIVWQPVAYVMRFAFILLIEPQVNPVKHFPVVTVSHKMLLPLIGVLSETAGITLKTAGLIIAAIPGVFGFIVWELRANWRLYGATRSAELESVVLGHHGETLGRFLRPGFHSGTVPKLYRVWRRAWVKARLENRMVPLTSHPDKIDHVGEVIGHWIDEELVHRLNRTRPWARTPLGHPRVAVGVQSFAVTVPRLAADGPAPIRLIFWLAGEEVALDAERPDWLTGPLGESFDLALTGLAAQAGVPGAAVAYQDWVETWDRLRQTEQL